MKQVLSDITIWFGAIIATLTILDWLLNDRQKTQLKRFGEDLWLWLAEQKGGKFIQVVNGYKVQLFISVTLWGLLTLIYAFAIGFFTIAPQSSTDESFRQLRWAMVLSFICACVWLVFVGWKIHPRVLAWITLGASVGRYFLRAIAALASCLVSFSGMFVFLVAMSLMLTMLLLTISGYEDNKIASLEALLSTFFSMVLIFPVCAEAGLLIYVILLSAVWCAVVYIVIGMMRTLQFVLLRIVDNPKGPVLGLSGLLVGVAALVKAFL